MDTCGGSDARRTHQMCPCGGSGDETGVRARFARNKDRSTDGSRPDARRLCAGTAAATVSTTVARASTPSPTDDTESPPASSATTETPCASHGGNTASVIARWYSGHSGAPTSVIAG